jgi:galactose mutarotase-like enzyme
VFDRLVSRRVTYGAADGPRVVVRFDGMPMLGVWTKPGGAHFICIEPWHGMADEVGFDGELADKPGMVLIAPGMSHAFAMSIELVDD